MLNNRASSIATPFFKQLIINENHDDFLLDKDRCLEFFKFLKGKNVEAKEFRKVKLNVFFNEYREINKYYQCALIKENSSWISVDENGEYRYFSQKPNGKVFIFDILDLLQIVYKINYKDVLIWLKDELDILIKDKFFRDESDKYLENINFIYSDTFLNSVTKEVSKEKEDIYAELNKIGLENLFSKTLTHMENAMFFASTSYIRDRLNGKYSSSTINKVINTFSVIGMINKVKEEDIPVEFREGNKRKVQNFTSYYSIPNISDRFSAIEEKSKDLQENNLSYYNLTKKKVLEVFNKDTFDEVYIQQTYHGKTYVDDERLSFMNIFFNIFNEYKYVSKDLFYNNCPKGYAKSFLDKEFEDIAKLNNFKIVRPNNRLKKTLNLTKNSNVAIRY